jgi:hypothetical protein
MATAEKSSIDKSWSAEGLPINVAFELIAKPTWDDYSAPFITFIVPGTTTESERGLVRHSRAQAALDALLRKCVSSGEFELWARPDRPWADLKLIPPSQVGDLKVDYAQRTARYVWDRNAGPPSLYDLHLRRVAGPAHTSVTAEPEPPAQMEPKDWFDEARKNHKQRLRERPGDYAKRLHDLMQADPRVGRVWSLGTLTRRLYDKP